jgi:glycerophosphoryl diester phosphodiesterase
MRLNSSSSAPRRPGTWLALWPARATMTTILAHRGNIAGPSPREENRLPIITTALARGWGLEVDIRRARDGRFYLSHDPQPSADDGLLAGKWCAALRRAPGAVVALNVKELGDEEDLIGFLRAEQVLRQVVLFDMELIEPVPGDTARRLRALNPLVRIAARVSDRGESIDRALAIDAASVIWLDEFDRQWSTEADVWRLKKAGRAVFAVSPELHRFPLDRARARWTDFIEWGVDAICTDYPAELARTIAAARDGVTA